ncbi:uncharacterized protein LOC129573715 [Sitodiplosis mosellana]|uniref:uncharacterized protein LOC129573715 n=1 Tax=Sitodiplosis mosellana TaxID=263140 RepID=UPI0024439A9D|nr:uncharacterized protein LOC129573715 [Sitodiplosis mosellana]
MSCARPPNFLLRKQKSLVCESVCQTTTICARERRLRLQKQYSVDHGRDISAHRSANNNSNNGQIQQKNGNLVTNSWGCNNPSPEASLRIFTAIKNKTQSHEGDSNEEVQKSSENIPLPNKSRKKNEEKINLNIFLAHVPELDLGSDLESNIRQTNGKPENAGDRSDTNRSMANRLTVETRRSQFRQKSVSLNETRPRLIRAMSAPIRPNPPPEAQDKVIATNANGQMQSGSKRRLRRKKIAPIEIDSFSLKIAQSQPYASKLVSQRTFDEQRPSTAKAINIHPLKSSAKPPKPILQPRNKSAMHGCEIVTLVSLLSPGASDSEKEDYSNGGNDSPNEKSTPSLRKVGKSVSFQDDDSLCDDDPVIDLPSVLRRASLAPLAAKIRLNRPPTAPPGSIFHKSIAISENSAMSGDNKVAAGGATETSESKVHTILPFGHPNGGEISKVPIDIVNATVPMRKPSIDILDPTTIYPEYVRSIKEKECWLLFQKMVKKGIAVSYETILRGMLTPSEVRAVEKKQKEIVERQASIDLEAAAAALAPADCDNNKK